MSFFERQTEPTEGAAHGGRRDSDPFRIFERLAMLLEGEVGIGLCLVGQSHLEHPALPGGRSRHRPLGSASPVSRGNLR